MQNNLLIFFFSFFFFFIRKIQKRVLIKTKLLTIRRTLRSCVGGDRTTGIGVEHMNEAIEVMAEEGENEVNSPITQQPHQHFVSTSSAIEPHQRKRSR